MTGLFGVMDATEDDVIYTYECDSAEEAAGLYLDDPDCAGTVVRVWTLGRHPKAFVKSKSGAVLPSGSPDPVRK
jgi:hypothetical protein